MGKGKKKSGAKQSQDDEGDDDWEALLEAESKFVEPKAADEETAAFDDVKELAVEAPVVQDAAAAFLAAQGLAPADGGGDKKDTKKKKKKKKAGASGEKADEKVRKDMSLARVLCTVFLWFSSYLSFVQMRIAHLIPCIFFNLN